MRVAFTTLGCRTNQSDSAEMQSILENAGYSIVPSANLADIYIINTCTVTAKSDASSRQAVKKSLAINQDALVVFTGCYAQMSPDEAASLPGMDIVLGNADKLSIADVLKIKLEQIQQENSHGLPLIHMSDIGQKWDFKPLPVDDYQGKSKAFIKIQTGCDEACSFCTVVHARGRSISDSRQNILNNVHHAIDKGFKEITLTGINLGTWGLDFDKKESVSNLIAEIAQIKGEHRIRLSSINPMEIDDDLIQLVSQSDNICPHFHVPLQSGDDTILKKMRRNYNSHEYRDVIERIVSTIPKVALGADVIVGFPGETETNFDNTYKMISDFPFTYLHVFSYSARNHTEANAFRKDEVPKQIKKERNAKLTELAKTKSQDFRNSLTHQNCQVLIENSRDAKTGKLRGHSERFIPVQLDGPDSLMDQLVDTEITGIDSNCMQGKIKTN